MLDREVCRRGMVLQAEMRNGSSAIQVERSITHIVGAIDIPPSTNIRLALMTASSPQP